MTLLDTRPRVGKLVVPFVVDESNDPIDFKALDMEHVARCANEGLCGVCGGRVRRGPMAFIGPADGRSCFADPWMHPECAKVALDQCPFLAGRRGFREGGDPLTDTYEEGMVGVLAFNWRSHRDQMGAWHFEAIGEQRPLA